MLRQSVALRLFHCEALHPADQLLLKISKLVCHCVQVTIGILPHSDWIFDLVAVLIFDRMGSIGDLVGDILFRNFWRLSDDLFSVGWVIIGPLLWDF